LLSLCYYRIQELIERQLNFVQTKAMRWQLLQSPTADQYWEYLHSGKGMGGIIDIQSCAVSSYFILLLKITQRLLHLGVHLQQTALRKGAVMQ